MLIALIALKNDKLMNKEICITIVLKKMKFGVAFCDSECSLYLFFVLIDNESHPLLPSAPGAIAQARVDNEGKNDLMTLLREGMDA